jgi:hypothetical protein
MKLSFDKIIKIRESALVCKNNLSEEQQQKVNITNLMNFLTKTTGITLEEQSFEEIFFSELHKEHYSSNQKEFRFRGEDLFFNNLFWNIKKEDESLERINKLFGKTVYEMNNDELIKASIRLFTEIPHSGYKIIVKKNPKRHESGSLIRKKGLEKKFSKEYGNYWIQHICTDKYILPGVLQAKGITFGKQEILQKLLEEDYPEFGVNELFFKEKLKLRINYGPTNNRHPLEELHKTFYDAFKRYAEEKENLPKKYKKMYESGKKDLEFQKLFIPTFYYKQLEAQPN